MTPGLYGKGLTPHFWWMAGLLGALALAGLAWGGLSVLLWLQVALVPLAACWLLYVKVVPWLNEWRRSRAVGRLLHDVIEVEEQLDGARTHRELRHQLRRLETLRRTLQSMARMLPPHWQRETILWRWHLAQLRRLALRRLRRPESKVARFPAFETMSASFPLLGGRHDRTR